ncbi:hypothetical protein [Spongiivirga citrea]|uniref:Uncharacterized protein n=1 Tax=Spongiivirga citrea TaxID=1481457 RepID=A0A6M0CJU4_9FLAO|nr:hypothetical protein [Spongiivirga citrea]NER17243.1 hypothetical protein [Spongiivirga citrea]
MGTAVSRNSNRLVLINLIIIAYFLMTYILHVFKIDAVFIGVIRELSTIPFLIAQIVFLVIGIVTITKSQTTNKLLLISVILLGVCALFTLGSFF